MPNKVLLTKFHDAGTGDYNLCTVEAEAEIGSLIFDDDLGAYVEGPGGYKCELKAVIPEPVYRYDGDQIDGNIDGNAVTVSLTVTEPDGSRTVYVPAKGFGDAIIWQEE